MGMLGKVSNRFKDGRISINWWNHEPSYVGLLDKLEDVRLLLEQRSKTEKLDQVLRQFGYRQRIPPPPRDMKELHKVDMWGKNDEDWAEKHIQAWDHRMKSIPVREPFLSANTVTTNDYLAWFRVVGKSYLLPSMAMSRQIRSNRQC
ncbi:hypothetical protein Golax_005210 [Gossypium laxum]|uniref:Aminotransferase-like plant mobile domain-containing protein n=1 Tax=Gossypium laxum TaxID=34288 RepID=A0A7J9A0J6_9ROSI|nr:hypothetical protein [Gossypium laxum]